LGDLVVGGYVPESNDTLNVNCFIVYEIKNSEDDVTIDVYEELTLRTR